MKRKTFLSLAAVLVLTLAAGCAQNNGSDEVLSTPVSEETVDNTVSEEEVSEAAQETAAEEADAGKEITAVEETADTEQNMEQQAFDSIVVDIEKGRITIRKGDSFSYIREDGGEADYEIIDGTLRISQNQDHKTVLTLPEYEYSDISLTVGEGDLYAEGTLSSRSLEVYVTKGEAALSSVAVADSSVIEVSEGSISLSGDPGKSVTARSEKGHLDMGVSGSQSSYNISFELSEGNVRLGDTDYHDRSLSKNIDNGAEKTMTLTCTKGDLSVGFAG